MPRRHPPLASPSRAGAGWTLVLALAGPAAMAPAALADDVAQDARQAQALLELTRPASRIEIGLGATDASPPAAGLRGGLGLRQGAGAFGSFDLRGSQYSFGNAEDDMTRWRLSGSYPGLHARSLAGEYGQQGNYRFTLEHDHYRHLVSDSYQTPLRGAGSAELVLPAGFVRGADTRAMPALAASMQRFDVQSTRQRSGIGLGYWLDPNWELTLRLRNDTVEGTRIRGAEFGSNGGNPRALLLPEPIDASTQLIDASLALVQDSYRFTFHYHGSIYRNRIGSLTWQNPFTSAPWVGGASGLPAGFALPDGRIGLAPDNEFHQVGVSGSVDFSPTTRLALTATRGRMTQDQAFLPYTINPGLVTTGLPRDSLDGRVQTSLLNLRLSMRPVRSLSLTAGLRHESRDNRTPQSEFIYVGGDIGLQPPPASSTDRIRTNLPRSRRQDQLSLEAVVRAAPRHRFTAGWQREAVTRTFAEVERATEDSYRLDYRHGGDGPWTVNAELARQQRRGTPYQYNLPFLASYTSAAYIAGLASANGCAEPARCVRSAPLQDKFYLADRDRERTRLTIGYMPGGALSVQGRVELTRDRFVHAPYGLTGTHGGSAGVDLAYAPGDDVSLSLFGFREAQRSSQRSRQITAFSAAVPTTPASDWTSRMADTSTTIGVGARRSGLMGGRLALDADLVLMDGRTRITTTVGPAVSAAWNPATALPDLRARSRSLTLTALYALDRDSSIRLAYFHRRLRSEDWAYQQVGVATLANVIGSAELPLRHAVQGVGVSYVWRFR